MRGSGIATRRFYNAFYRWTLLNEAPHGQHRALRTSSHPVNRGSRNHGNTSPTEFRRRGRDAENVYSRPRARSNTGRYTSAEDRRISRPTGRDEPDGVFNSRPSAFRTREHEKKKSLSIIHTIQSSPEERPFATLAPWEEVVRHSSFAGFSVEMCIPRDAIDYMERNGSLRSLLNLTDLHIDIGSTSTPNNGSGDEVAVKSVLATGTVVNIDLLREEFRKVREYLERIALNIRSELTTRDGSIARKLAYQRYQASQTPLEFDSAHLWKEEDQPAADAYQQYKANQSSLESNRAHVRKDDDQPAADAYRQYKISQLPIEYKDTQVRQQDTQVEQQDIRVGQQVTRVGQNHSEVGQQDDQASIDYKWGGSDPKVPQAQKAEQQQEKRKTYSQDKEQLQLFFPWRFTLGDKDKNFVWSRPLSLRITALRKRINRSELDCYITKIERGFFLFKGSAAGIAEARTIVQNELDLMCDEQSVPRRQLQEASPDAKTRLYDLNFGLRDHKSESLKLALRPLTHPVVLIIAFLRNERFEASPDMDQLRGVTVSSLTSVSFDEGPVISFNVKLPSRTWDAMEANKAINVNFITATAEGAALAHAFTKPHEDPTEPFRQIQRLGYEMATQFGTIRRLSKVSADTGTGESAVYFSLVAIIIKDRCMKVSDHMIVVAKVAHVWLAPGYEKLVESGEAQGLAYANRAYRAAGEKLEPIAIPEPQDGQHDDQIAREVSTYQDVGDEGNAIMEHQLSDQFDQKDESKVDVIGDLEPLSQGDKDHIAPSEQPSHNAPNGTSPSRAEDFAQPRTTQPSTTIEDEQTLKSLEQMETERIIENEETESRDQPWPGVLQDDAPATEAPKEESRSPPTPPQPVSSFGFLKQFWRSYSTSARRLAATPDHSASTSTDPDQIISKVTDPSLLTTTAGDFIGAPAYDDPYIPRRMKALMKARKESEQASSRLQHLLQTGELTPEESERLENIITRNERWISKKLAFNSAYDLRIMLDKGKVDVRRAQWLESSIEKGQAVLLEEKKQLRALLEQGKVDEAKFREMEEALEQDNLSLATEAMRLRQMVDEDGEDHVAAPEEDERKGFDGFRGNV